MSRPRLLDLFCGGGGAGMGYHLAGFDVVGVDNKPQPRYPFTFVQADAMTYPLDGFDVIHASPPCQAYTTMSNRWRGSAGKADQHPDLIGIVSARLIASGLLWVLENVAGARAQMVNPLTLHGGMFGLGVARPRLFDSGLLLMAPSARPAVNPVGVYGKAHDGRLLFRRADGSEQRAANSLEQAQAAMGVDWMNWRELAESIPPAYTQFIGEQLLAALAVAA